MGLLDLLRKLKRSDREAKILILGLDNAGKTTLLKFISSENPKDTTTTKGFNVKTIVKDSKKLNVWDIGGQKEIRQYWENYYDNVDGLIFVVDSSDDYRIKECNEEFKLLISDAKLEKVPVLVYANKQDIDGALSADEIMKSLDLEEITQRPWSITSCSALTGEGVKDGLEWLVDKAVKKTD